MPHYDARKALHDPNPVPRPAPPPARQVALDVDGMAARVAAALCRRGPEEWPMLQRLYAERLLDYLEEGYEPAQVDDAVARFVERLRAGLTNPGCL